MTNNHLRHIFIIFIIILLSGCAQYSRDMLWENKIKPTPYDAPDHFVRPGRWSDEEVTYAWLGHATVLINFYGTWIVTDPVLLDRIGPPEVFDNLFGIKRITQLPLTDDELPAVDIVLVSHPHFDHLDLASLRQLNESADYNLVVPALTKDLIDEEIKNITELDWLDRADKTIDIENLTISAFRVEHYGYADWGERDIKRGFNGYLVMSKNSAVNTRKTIAFFGDTSYSRYRDENGDVLDKPMSINWPEKFDSGILRAGIDLCIIPVGDSYYYWNHISPKNAIRLAHDLHCKKMLPVHYATFVLTPPENEPIKPKQQLLEALDMIHDDNLVTCSTVKDNSIFPDIGLTCKLP